MATWRSGSGSRVTARGIPWYSSACIRRPRRVGALPSNKRDGPPANTEAVDPLACPVCGGAMRILAFITEGAVIDRILAPLRQARGAALGGRPSALALQALPGFRFLAFQIPILQCVAPTHDVHPGQEGRGWPRRIPRQSAGEVRTTYHETATDLVTSCKQRATVPASRSPALRRRPVGDRARSTSRMAAGNIGPHTMPRGWPAMVRSAPGSAMASG